MERYPLLGQFHYFTGIYFNKKINYCIILRTHPFNWMSFFIAKTFFFKHIRHNFFMVNSDLFMPVIFSSYFLPLLLKSSLGSG